MPPSEPVLIGVSWYPEMWEESEWEADLIRMREVGLRMVRVFEFAWAKMEPCEGVFDFVWAHRVLDLCAKHGIAVMIGTPSAAPPVWLTAKDLGVLGTDALGHRKTHGQRKHYNPHSAVYRTHCGRIVRAMAEAFSQHPALHSWQIDNEMGGFDYGEETKAGFHRWLAQEFGTVEELNRRWGLNFWSQRYEEFSQVPLCTADVGSIEVPERHHPSLILAIARFNNEAWTGFIAEQCGILREYSERPITTNMTPGAAMDWSAHNRVLDRVGVSLYRDVEHYAWNAEFYDRMRAEKPAPYWLLETAPNWSATGRAWNIHHNGDGVQAMAWMSVFMGGSMVLFWQWREHWAGQEMQHGVFVSATGKWRPNRSAITKLCADTRRVENWLAAHPAARARVAIVRSSQAAWAFSIDPGGDDMGYVERWREDFHLPLMRRHIWRDVIPDTASLEGYDLVIIPHLPVLPAAMRERLAAFVEAGGHAIIGPYTGYRTEDFTAFRDRDFGGLEDLCGAESALRFTSHWVEDKVAIAFADGSPDGRTRTFAEAWDVRPGTKVVARYRGGSGDGLPAIVRRRVGRGEVTLVGCRLDDAARWRLTAHHLDALGIAPLATGACGVMVAPRVDATGRVAGFGLVNLSADVQCLTLPSSGIDLITGETCGPVVELPPLATRLVACQDAG